MMGTLKGIANSAAAADGGSLLLVLEWDDGHFEILGLKRSIAARGTAAYNMVGSDTRSLSRTECLDIANELEQVFDRTPTASRSLLLEFITALKKQGERVCAEPRTSST
jgi:hypothetical protein